MRLIDADHFSERLVQASKYWNADKADSHDKGVAQGLLEADEKLVDEHTIQAIPLDKVKQARRELDKLPIYGAKFTDDFRIHLDREEVFSILDKLIEESEET